MADTHYIIVTVECSSCKMKQKLHVASGTGAAQERAERIRCIDCGYYFAVSVPDKILRGPFPA
jgi:hypothetical protein